MKNTQHVSFSSKAARRNLIVCMVIALLIFWAAASQITKVGMAKWEQSLFDVIYNLPINLKLYFLGISQAGSVFMVVVMCGILLLMRHRLYAARVLLISISTYAVVWVGKNYFARPRPNLLLHYVSQRGPHEADFSFPSAHAALSMAIGISLLPLIPRKWWWLVFVSIFLVGVSRIYLGVHAPLDIIAGFAVGLFVSSTYLLVLASRNNKNKSNIKTQKNKTV